MFAIWTRWQSVATAAIHAGRLGARGGLHGAALQLCNPASKVMDMSLSQSSTEPPPDPDTALAPLRAELDDIDDSVLALLRRRAEVVQQVGQLKQGVAIRAGREAAILRRLLATAHAPLPDAAIVRVWREIFAASTSQQGPFSISVCETDASGAMAACAREHFGALTPLHLYHTPAQAIAAVAQAGASAAVLPMPDGAPGPMGAWWVSLLGREVPRIFVVARLPFWAPRSLGSPAVSALVVAAAEPDPSGVDRTLVALELNGALSRAHLSARFTEAGLPPSAMIVRDQGGIGYALFELDGFVEENDSRLTSVTGLPRPPVVLGAYAVSPASKLDDKEASR